MAAVVDARKEPLLLQTPNTIKLGIYCMLQCLQSTDNEYIFIIDSKDYNNELIEIIDENMGIGIGTMQIKNVSFDAKILKLQKENETEIVKTICKYYLNPIHRNKWNQMIGDFFGANFYAFNKINHSMPTKMKLKKLLQEYYYDESKIQENMDQINKYIHCKNEFYKRFPWYHDIPFFAKTNNKKQKLEALIIENKYNDALNVLEEDNNNNNNDKNIDNRQDRYYKNIYSIIIRMYQYSQYQQQNDKNMQHIYFRKMLVLLADLTNFMEPADSMTCSLFAEVLINYNPNILTQKEWTFAIDMTLAACCYMFTHSDPNINDIYNVMGSINSNIFLLQLIDDGKLNKNDEIIDCIIRNIQKLFFVFNEIDNNKMSQVCKRRINKLQCLWQEKKCKWMKSMQDITNNVNNGGTLQCHICNKGNFKNKRALVGHLSHHSVKRINNQKAKKNQFNDKKLQRKIASAPTIRPKPKIRRDHGGNFKRHKNNIHINNNNNNNNNNRKHRKFKFKLTMNNKSTQKRKRKRDEMKNDNNNNNGNNDNNDNKTDIIVLSSDDNEPPKKRQRADGTLEDIYKCNQCDFTSLTKVGIGTHRGKKHRKTKQCNLRKQAKKSTKTTTKTATKTSIKTETKTATKTETKTARKMSYNLRCLRCGFIAKSKQGLSSHITKAHNKKIGKIIINDNKQIYQCNKCDKQWPTFKQLRAHQSQSKDALHIGNIIKIEEKKEITTILDDSDHSIFSIEDDSDDDDESDGNGMYGIKLLNKTLID